MVALAASAGGVVLVALAETVVVVTVVAAAAVPHAVVGHVVDVAEPRVAVGHAEESAVGSAEGFAAGSAVASASPEVVQCAWVPWELLAEDVASVVPSDAECVSPWSSPGVSFQLVPCESACSSRLYVESAWSVHCASPDFRA